MQSCCFPASAESASSQCLFRESALSQHRFLAPAPNQRDQELAVLAQNIGADLALACTEGGGPALTWEDGADLALAQLLPWDKGTDSETKALKSADITLRSADL